MNTYIPFEIWVDPAPGKAHAYSVRVADSPYGVVSGSFSLDLQEPEFQLERTTVEGDGVDLDARKSFGGRLFQALFAGKVRDAWTNSLGRIAAGQAAGLRLRLWINDPALAELPWELLWDEDTGFLATNANMAFSRYLPVPEPPVLAVQWPIKILLAVASPPGLEPIPDSLVEKIQAAISSLGKAVQLTLLKNATLTTLQQELQKGVHIFNFLGYGLPGKVVLVGENGKPMEVIDSEAFAQLFGGRNLRLAMFNNCASGVGAGGAFSGIGPALVQKHLPAVIAMQYPTVQMDTAVNFSAAFFQALTQGLPVDVAVNEGRKALSAGPLLGARDWSTPVLFLGMRSGTILDVIPPEAKAEVSAWAGVSAALQSSDVDQEKLVKLTAAFRQIVALQRGLEAFDQLRGRLEALNAKFYECLKLAEKAGDPANLDFKHLKPRWLELKPDLLNLAVYLEDHQEIVETVGLKPLAGKSAAIDKALSQMALLDLRNGVQALGALLQEAAVKTRSEYIKSLDSLLTLSEVTLGRFASS